MLAFVATDDHQYTVRNILETREHALQGNVMLLSYRDFLSWPKLPAADYVFVDLERLSTPALRAAGARYGALATAVPGLRSLNRPDPALTRLSVMGRLREAGINQFRVVPALENQEPLRFPVFIRRIDDHDGPMSALLPDAAALRDAIATAGIPAEALAVTEYVDARNSEGHHEKLSYFRIGGQLFPSALDTSRNWVCKGMVGDPDTIENHEREQAFLAGNPHAEQMKLAFDAAGIGYGRADYAIVDGRPQIFEINTNPLIDQPEAMPKALRSYANLLVSRWLAALAGFSPPTRTSARWIEVPGSMPQPAAPGRQRLRRALRGILGTTGQLHNETRVMRPLRTLGIAR